MTIAEACKLAGLPADKKPELLMLPKQRNPLDTLLGSDGERETHDDVSRGEDR